MQNLADDVMQLLLDDNDGLPDVSQGYADLGVAGAVLLELVDAGRIASPDGAEMPAGSAAGTGKVTVLDASPTGSAVLDRALAKLTDRSVRSITFPRAAVLIGKDVRRAVLDQLVQRGLVRRDERKLLGIVRLTTWPAADTAHEAALRQQIDAAVRGGQTPDERTGVLIGLLHAVDAVHKVLPGPKAQLRSRAAEIAREHWIAAVVHEAMTYSKSLSTTAAAAAAAAG